MNNFDFEMDGFGRLGLLDVFRQANVESIAIPVGHSLTAAWLVVVSLGGMLVEICSVSNDLGNWQEVGSLRLRLIVGERYDLPEVEWISYAVANFHVASIEKIEYGESNFHTECGICLRSSTGNEIWVVAAPAPGSVSVKLPNSCEDFVTEFLLEEYTRTHLIDG